MNWAILFPVAAVAAVFGFGRDLLGLVVRNRRKYIESGREQIMQPLEVHGIVLKDTKDVLAVQSTLLLELRNSVADLDRRRVQAEAERDAMAVRVKEAEAERTRLLIQLGQAYGASFGHPSQPPVQ